MKICKNCTLPSAVPSAKIDESGLCVYCRQFKGREDLQRQRREYKHKFENLVEEQKKRSQGGPYDVLAAYSGGKDSSFTLDLLKNRYGLRVLALTFDHGFVSPYAFENIRKVVEVLGIDHITFKPDFNTIKKAFRFSIKNEYHPPKALERASSICNTCMGLVKFVTLRAAMEKKIPLVAYGWSPGQAPIQSAILKNHPSFVRKAQELFLKPLEAAIGSSIHAYFIEEWSSSEGDYPYNINPLAFLHYDEETIYSRIRQLGWESPKDTDPNSTNCLVNAFANQVHEEKHKYNPYAMEMAELVREGILSADEVLRRTRQKADPLIIERVKERLGVDGD